MSSWLARSIAESLQIDNGEDEDDLPTTTTTTTDNSNNHHPSVIKEQEFNREEQGSDSETLTEVGGGSSVKGDLSEFTESLARQFRGVASFLAPPPPPPPPPPLRHRLPAVATRPDPSDGVSNSVCEFGGEDEEEEDVGRDFVVGVTEEVLTFATNIAHHPETWLDFPLSEEEDEEDNDDFEMSDTQWNHSTLVEHLVPRLAALRIELCPIHMSESYFWKVYFVLLLPRLNKHDALLLSTPQIVAARTMWMKELQMQSKARSDSVDIHEEFYHTSSSDSPSAYRSERTTHAFQPAEKEPTYEQQPTVTKQQQESTSDQRMLPSYRIPIVDDFDEDDDDWIHDNAVELDGYVGPDVPIGADEDISFSDLEDDDDCTMPYKIYKPI